MGALKLEEVDRFVDNKRKLPIYLIFTIFPINKLCKNNEPLVATKNITHY